MNDFLFRFFVAVAVLVFGASSAIQAAPVTFAFDAEITLIDRSPDATFDLPSNAMVGDALSGLLQFEPFSFGQSIQASNLSVNLGSEIFSIEGAPLTTQNNLALALHPVGVAIVDSIGVGLCPSISSCTVALSSSSNDIELAHLWLWLSGVTEYEIGSGEGLIGTGESLGDADVWNRLTNRRVFMTFISSSGPGSIQLEAVIGSMTAIPEPSSLMLMMIGATCLPWHLIRCK